MTNSVLRVIIDASGAQAGAQTVNNALSSVTNTATQSINTLSQFSKNLQNQLNSLSSGVSFAGLASSFNSALNQMTSGVQKFLSGFAAQFGGSGIHGTARSFGKKLGDSINSGIDDALKGLRNILLDVFSLSAIQEFLQKIAEVGTQVQRFKTVVEGITGSRAGANEAFENARNTANKYGLSIESLLQPYTRLLAATNETKLSTGQVDTMFKGIAAAASTYHLSQTEVNLVMLAFNQMISKGTVSMEELRRQLGERIPGVFEMSAKAIGKTTAELEDLIKKGMLKGPEFAALLGSVFNDKFSTTAEKVSLTYFGAMNRMRNATFKFFETLADSGVLDAFTRVIEKFIGLLDNDKSIKAFGQSITILVDQFLTWFTKITPQDVESFFKTMSEGIRLVSTALKFIVDNADTITRVIGMAAGAKVGAVVGAAAGSIIPGVGTAVGAVGGGIIGMGVGGAGGSILVNKSKSKTFSGGATGEWEQGISSADAADAYAFPSQFGRFGSKKISAADVLKDPKKKKGLSDAQKSFRKGESVDESFSRFTRDFMDGLSPRKAVSNVPTIDQERFENQVKLAHKHTDAMDKLNDARRDGQITERDYGLRVESVTDTYRKSLVVLEDVLQKREEFRRTEADEVVTKTLVGFKDKSAAVFDELNQALSTKYLDQYDKKQAEITRSLNGNYLEAQHIFVDQLNSGKITADEYTKAIEKLNAALGKQKTEVADLIQRQKELNESWIKGVRDGLGSYLDTVSNTAQSVSNVVTKAFKGMEDALVKFVRTGKLDFKSLANSIIDDMIRMSIQEKVTKPLAKAGLSLLEKVFSGTPSEFPTVDAGISEVTFGGFDGGGYTGNASRSGGMDGKGGFLAMLHPQETVTDHTKGNSASPDVSVTVNLIESSSKAGQVEQRQSGGQKMIDVFVSQIRSAIANDISTGNGPVPLAMQSTYALNRAAGGR